MMNNLSKAICVSVLMILFQINVIAIDFIYHKTDTSFILSTQYQQLENFLKKNIEIQSAGGWNKIKLIKKVYNLGDTSSVIAEVRYHLFVCGDLNNYKKSSVFDSALYKAVILYRNRMGLKQDGKIDAALISEMNIPVEKRIEKIKVNLERMRRLYNHVDDNFILVNIPEFRLHVYEKSIPVYNMKVIIGQRSHKTVSFNGKIKYVVFCPYWNVPKSILNNELLPIIRHHPGYLTKHNMEWKGGLLRQKPGPANALGLIKFVFPNSHSIYMHDTPVKSLFSQQERTFSHGCIRLENARCLADYLLRDDPQWSRQAIDDAINRRTERYVPLKNPIPVYIVYFTSWVDGEGRLNFRKDIYRKDD